MVTTAQNPAFACIENSIPCDEEPSLASAHIQNCCQLHVSLYMWPAGVKLLVVFALHCTSTSHLHIA